MSKNKYKNNDLLNKKIKKPLGEQLEDLADVPPTLESPIDEEPVTDEVVPPLLEQSHDAEVYARPDLWDNAQAKLRPTAELLDESYDDEGGIGEFREQLTTEGISDEQMEEATEPPLDSNYVGAPPSRTGFPWWWILLPLLIIGLLYGLTRKPTESQTPPTSTTSQGPVMILKDRQARLNLENFRMTEIRPDSQRVPLA